MTRKKKVTVEMLPQHPQLVIDSQRAAFKKINTPFIMGNIKADWMKKNWNEIREAAPNNSINSSMPNKLTEAETDLTGFFLGLNFHGKFPGPANKKLCGNLRETETPILIPNFGKIFKKYSFDERTQTINQKFIKLASDRLSLSEHGMDAVDWLLVTNWSYAYRSFIFLKRWPLCECSNKAITNFLNYWLDNQLTEDAVRQRWRRLGLKRMKVKFRQFNVRLKPTEAFGFK